MPPVMDIDTVHARLKALGPQINQMMSIAGTTGLSYGVMLRGHVVIKENFGFSDVENQIPPDEGTIFPICSMTKGLVSSVVGMLVDEGKFKFDGLVRDLLPTYRPATKELESSARLSDWMSMQSGTQPYQLWFQSQNNIIFPMEDAMTIINHLQPEADLRASFDYSNWGYEVAAQVIKQSTGRSWDDMLHKRIFEPLGLTRTYARRLDDSTGNVAKAYTVLDNGTPINIRRTPISGATLLGAGGGVHSCIKDLLRLYQEILRSCIDQFQTGRTSTDGSVFKRLTTTMSAHSHLPGPSFRESTYGMGWLRTQLPNQMCKISPNLAVVGDEPILGIGAPSQLLIAHYGSMPGAYCGVNLFPETEAVIVLLSNTTPMCDIADWVIQLITQTLFDFPQKHDYVDWVQRTVDAEKGWYRRTAEELGRRQNPGTKPRPLSEYGGTYICDGKFFKITMLASDTYLEMKFQDLEDEVYYLKHYEHDTFSWLQPRDYFVSRGRWILQHPDYYLIRFCSHEATNQIDRLVWVNDPGVPQGQTFHKQG
ncbi:beta-lactamase/transpeptidase-like protein [Nemania abortiva]|nr:beta-lactamase/transpeptidase-like protein [Nemania abortiva]